MGGRLAERPSLGGAAVKAVRWSDRAIALSSKRAGVDIFHIGDAGYSGMALPENIQTLSITVRVKRHTYIRMAVSVLR